MPKHSWQPSANIDTLKKRATIIQDIRQFFIERHVLEVQTPSMCAATVTDVYIDSLRVACDTQDYYLQTSPEYAMKRLLASNCGDIFQIGNAFRADQQGRLHNPEFTLLEWYRLRFDHHQLMDEMDQLLQRILHCPAAARYSYQEVFEQHLKINPHAITLDDLQSLAKQHDLFDALGATCDNRDDWLMLLFSICIEPKLGATAPCFIYDYPTTQAALAKIDHGVAQRFEVYYKGVELANGFHELQDASEQSARFKKDLLKRNQLNKKIPPIDQRFIASLQAGLPACSGVALGIDRLIMLALNKKSVADVMSFSIERA